nr:hypothetical protein B0A51_00993 [Rachicladosporium sp. CCFEE 5018]
MSSGGSTAAETDELVVLDCASIASCAGDESLVDFVISRAVSKRRMATISDYAVTHQ